MLSSTKHYANRNPTSWVTYDSDSLIGEGKYKFVLKGIYDGGGVGAACKFLKSGTMFISDCFLDDIRAAEAVLPYISGFHQFIARTSFHGHVSNKINIPAVWEQFSGGPLHGQKVLVEPCIEEFQ
jgi:hypothetical protein